MKEIIKSQRLDESYIKIKDKSGLTILFYPMKKYSTSYVLFGTKYGSIDTTFKTNQDDEYTQIPAGVAHFLEHKLFENEDGDAFSLFASTGASANAYTTFDRTCYLFSCADNFEESLKHLLNFVQNPFFSEETVKKEQGIIGQEIKMYEDNPNWRVYFNLLAALFVNHPVKIDIAGTVETIAEIDSKMLYKCYETFYNLNNMVLVVAGNFDEDKALEVINANIKQSKDIEIDVKRVVEPREVAKKEVIQNLEVAMPLFNIGYKEIAVSGNELIKAKVETELLLDMIVGETSRLYRDLYDKGLINSTFGADVMASEGYFVSMIEGESKDTKQVEQEINKEILKFKGEKISKEDFEIAKKQLYGRYIRDFNRVDGVANAIVVSHFMNSSIFDTIEIVANLEISDIEKRLESSLNSEFSSISIINPKK
jgi:predicted Zn-dependent peptidase